MQRIFKNLKIIAFLTTLLLLITACASPQSNYEQPCNEKFHGVLIGERCFDCGANDGLCPDDFSKPTICTDFRDPDC